MGTIEVDGKNIAVDENGYLENVDDWTENVAIFLAERDQVDLTPAQWEIIRFLREYYKEYELSPAIRVMSKAITRKLGPEKGTTKYLYNLFPYGPDKQGCQYAGLPRPTAAI